MRAFVCSYLDPALQTRCREVIDALVRASGGGLRSVPDGTAHLTYAFIAALPDERLPHLVQGVAQAAAATAGVATVGLGRPDVLYGRAEARLVYLPVVDGRESLAGLARVMTDAARAALPGVDVTLTPAPHVTLARFRRGIRRREARQVEEAIARAPAMRPWSMRVGAVQVVESVTDPSGARYLVRGVAPLGR
jgi:2'-5' RNA ligase